ncbi:MFS transporter [Kitasatospora nipponensis]
MPAAPGPVPAPVPVPAPTATTGGEGVGPRAGYREVFAVGEFRAVFAAHLLAVLGNVVCELALAVLVFKRTGSPLLSALTFAVGLLPYAVGGTLLAAVADRYPARRVLVLCNLLCAGCAAGTVLPAVPVLALLVLRCLSATVAPVLTGTRAATLGDVLGEGDRFVLGRSVLRLVSQGAQLTGFAAGGLLLAAVPPRAVLGLTVATFLGSALLLRLGTRARPARTAPSARAGGAAVADRPSALVAPFALVADSLAGVRLLLGDPRIRALLLLAWVPPAFAVVSESLLTPYAGALGLGPAGLGLLMCGMPIGAITAESLAGSLLGPRGRARLTFPVAVLAMLPALGYAAHPAFGWALACQFLTGCGICYTLGLDQWFLAAVPERLRGQAMTLLTGGLMTAQGIGMTLAGTAAEFAPVHRVIATGGVLGTLAVAAVLLLVRRGRPPGPAACC